jgi:glutaminase
VLAVLPGRMGIATFSPRLDAQGNSVRGVKACQMLSREFGLHLFGVQRPGRSVIRSQTTLRSRRSSRVRPIAHAERLKAIGDSAVLLELQGDLHFSAIERVQRRLWQITEAATSDSNGDLAVAMVLLDFTRVSAIDPAVTDVLRLLAQRFTATDRQFILTGLAAGSTNRRLLEEECAGVTLFEDLDCALEASEEMLLNGTATAPRDADEAPAPAPATNFSVAELELASALDARDLRALERFLAAHSVDAGQCICRKGDPAQHVWFLTRGRVSVRLYSDDTAFQRLATFEPGSVFGEMAILDGGPRSADVWTESPVEYVSLALADLHRIEEQHPTLKIKVLRYLLGILTHRLRRANDLIGQLSA